MANEQNLKPVKSKSEARARGAKGGKASGEARRKKKALKEIAEAFGMAQAPDAVKAKLASSGLSSKKNLTLDEALILAQYGQALKGNTRAANFVAEIKGEKIQRVEQVIDDRSLDRLNEDFGIER